MNQLVFVCVDDSEGANIYPELSAANYTQPVCLADPLLSPPTYLSASLVARGVANDAASVAGVMPVDHVTSEYN